jgi:hypothetical protein
MRRFARPYASLPMHGWMPYKWHARQPPLSQISGGSAPAIKRLYSPGLDHELIR